MNLKKHNPLRKLTFRQVDILMIVMSTLMVITAGFTAWVARTQGVLFGLALALCLYSIYVVTVNVTHLVDANRDREKMLTALERLRSNLKKVAHDNDHETKP